MSYITHRRSGYGFGCCTKLTEVLGTGNTRVNARRPGQEFYFKQRFIQLAWHVLTGPKYSGQFVLVVGLLSTMTTWAKNRNYQRVATGSTAALTAPMP